jgi:cytoskeleton protein RodZ
MTVEQLSSPLPPRERPKTAGQMLREARERLGLSTGEVATITRIPRVMLEHLERDQFQEYCAPVFVKGHLSNFARAVRIDSERVLIAYERQLGLSAPAPVRAVEAAPVVAIAPVLVTARAVTAPLPAVAAVQAAPMAPPRVAPRAGSPRKRRTTNRGLPSLPALPGSIQGMRPTSMVAVLLVLCAIAVFGGVFVTNRATAQNTAKFSESSGEDWSLEKDTQETRWLLERPASLPAALPAAASDEN